VGSPVRIVLSADGRVRDVGIYDLAGHRVQRFRTAAREIVWSGIDASGQVVGPGVYWVRVEDASGAGVSARTIVRVRR
jgi:hypothetical protein